MTVSLPAFKHLLFDVIVYTDDLDDKGQRIPRSGWAKAHAPHASSLKVKLADDILYGQESDDGFVTREEMSRLLKADPSMKFTRQRFSDNDIEFTEKELLAFVYCYETLSEIADYGQEAFTLLQEVLENK